MEPRQPDPNHRRRVIAVIAVDLAVIGELFVAMYFAHAHREQFTVVFLAVFFGLLLPTLVLSRLLLRRLAPPGGAEDGTPVAAAQRPMLH